MRVDSTATTPTDGSACKAVLNCAAGMAGSGLSHQRGEGKEGLEDD